jgi:hypothetical protein
MDDGLRAVQSLADKIKQGKLLNGVTVYDAARSQWRYVKTDHAVQAVRRGLEHNDWISGYSDNKGQASGKSTWRCRISPKIQNA